MCYTFHIAHSRPSGALHKALLTTELHRHPDDKSLSLLPGGSFPASVLYGLIVTIYLVFHEKVMAQRKRNINCRIWETEGGRGGGGGGGERERETDRQTETDRERERQTVRDRERQWQTDRRTEIQRR